MERIDCSNIFNFISEWERRKQKDSSFVSLGYALACFCHPMDDKTKEILEELQKWSDENPRQTRKEKFEKLMKENGFEDVLPRLSSHRNDDSCKQCAVCLKGHCADAVEYWNSYVD